MLFSGIPFLFFFFPCVLILYYLAPKSLKNSVLLISSLFFYAWGEQKYTIILIISVLCGYVFGLLIEKSRGKALKRLFLVLSVVQNLAFLCYFKYADFFIANFNAVTGYLIRILKSFLPFIAVFENLPYPEPIINIEHMISMIDTNALSLPLLHTILPIGISFYTFQILSYTVDVYRGNVKAQKNPINLGAYIAMFPQLIAGPIVRYSDVEKQLQVRTHSMEKAALGVRRFTIGLAKKVLLANRLGELCDMFRASDDKSVLFYWVYAISYCLHIYFDFSGYSDMAIGLGHIFGFNFVENFNYPFISKSVTEFWRRWHMSLGTWFRDYVYIPMGGNRVGWWRHIINILTVWMLTGMWHGASWNFIIWGLYFAILLMAEKFFLMKLLKKSKVISRIYLLIVVIISFMIFNATDIKMAYDDIISMFGFGRLPLFSYETGYYIRTYAITLIIAIFGATPVASMLLKKADGVSMLAKVKNVLECVIIPAMLIICTAFLVDGSFNPFLYFRF